MELSQPLVKAVFLGETNTGKTSIMLRWVSKTYNNFTKSTNGMDLKKNYVNVGDSRLMFLLWDTAGQKMFRSLNRNYYDGAHVFLLVYDITCESSYRTAESTGMDIREHVLQPHITVLIGNKCDLSESRVVETDHAKQFAVDHGYMFCEISAKTGEGIEQLFLKVATRALQLRIFARRILTYEDIEKEESRALCCCCFRSQKTKESWSQGDPHAYSRIASMWEYKQESPAQQNIPKNTRERVMAHKQKKNRQYFISYKQNESKDLALELWYNLGQNKPGGVWLDVKNGSQDLRDMMMGVEECKYFLLLLSPGYFDSDYCVMEAKTAVRMKRKIILVYNIDQMCKNQLGPILTEGKRKGITGSWPSAIPISTNPTILNSQLKEIKLHVTERRARPLSNARLDGSRV